MSRKIDGQGACAIYMHTFHVQYICTKSMAKVIGDGKKTTEENSSTVFASQRNFVGRNSTRTQGKESGLWNPMGQTTGFHSAGSIAVEVGEWATTRENNSTSGGAGSWAGELRLPRGGGTRAGGAGVWGGWREVGAGAHPY